VLTFEHSLGDFGRKMLLNVEGTAIGSNFTEHCLEAVFTEVQKVRRNRKACLTFMERVMTGVFGMGGSAFRPHRVRTSMQSSLLSHETCNGYTVDRGLKSVRGVQYP